MLVNVLLFNVDPAGNDLTGDRDANRIAERLNGLFRHTLARGAALHLNVAGLQIIARWVACGAQISVANTDVVLYFITNTSRSVVSAIGGLSPSANETGFTNFQRQPLGQTGGEVYTQPLVQSNNPTHATTTLRVNGDNMTAVAYHEVMHYKLHYDDAQLHNIPGGRLARANPSAQVLTPSDGDIRALVPGLANAWAPFLEGCTRYRDHITAEENARNDLRNLGR